MSVLLGLIGSVTHCVGMYGGVMLLLGRGRAMTGWRRLALVYDPSSGNFVPWR
ncbi:MAG: hypothetical protein ACUVR4_14825 [Anaerolineae bacterium]